MLPGAKDGPEIHEGLFIPASSGTDMPLKCGGHGRINFHSAKNNFCKSPGTHGTWNKQEKNKSVITRIHTNKSQCSTGTEK